jgi:hypothetical protein
MQLSLTAAAHYRGNGQVAVITRYSYLHLHDNVNPGSAVITNFYSASLRDMKTSVADT